MSSEIQLISKIAPRTVVGRFPKPTKQEKLFSVYGLASGLQSGESSYGTWECLTGNFEAVNLATGEAFQSPRCFLPHTAHGMIASQFKTGAEGVSVKFALEIGVKPAETSVGYEYTVTPLVKPSEDDAMAKLRGEVSGQLRLAKPKASK